MSEKRYAALTITVEISLPNGALFDVEKFDLIEAIRKEGSIVGRSREGPRFKEISFDGSREIFRLLSVS